MLIAPDVQVNAYDDGRFIINTQEDRHLLVNEAAVKLLTILRTAPDLGTANVWFNQAFTANLSLDAFQEFVQQRFGGYRILVGDEQATKQVPQEYIRLKLELFNHRMAGFCAAPLKAFYAPRVFWPCLAVLLAFLAAIHLQFSVIKRGIGSDYWWAIPLVYLSIFVHEFGHIAACRKFNVRHGGVGFGFYLFIFPVLYADVTNIWRVDKHRRIITNLGGIFSQLLYASLLGMLFIGTRFNPLLYASMTITVSALWQLNPFVRHDGYWVLSDLTSTPNLLWKASAMLRKAFSWHALQRVWQEGGSAWQSKRLFLLLYGLLNNALIFVFGYFVVTRYADQLLNFPHTVGLLVSHLLHGEFGLVDMRKFPLIALAFYLTTIRYLWAIGLKSLTRFRAADKQLILAPS